MGATGEEHNFVNSSFEIHLVRRFAGMDQAVAVKHVSLGLRNIFSTSHPEAEQSSRVRVS